ncbi:nudix hydrolase 20, chloroplastic-like isoform X1 [Asterias rubens]|uniref:nudix hydrolase 20, chloroplastic-like isoform X1 n=1 Tax=Asterias rubens TaxID=7604 RepID=UPI001455A9B8|nr:nudix hydrolase 20, chloroplastic-like isoform X1 [Asterias rubens]
MRCRSSVVDITVSFAIGISGLTRIIKTCDCQHRGQCIINGFGSHYQYYHHSHQQDRTPLGFNKSFLNCRHHRHLNLLRSCSTEMAASSGTVDRLWSDQMFEVVTWCNSFYSIDSSRSKCKPFFIENHQVGHITPTVLKHLQGYPDVFVITKDAASDAVERVSLSPSLKTFEERTSKMAVLLQNLKKLSVFRTLRGWRDEMYAVSSSYHDVALMDMERAATCLFGIKQYGVHLNGYCHHPTKGLCMWVGRRSSTKSTFPNRLDNVAAGGLPSGMSIKECLVKECAEEASIPECIAVKAVPAGAVSYFYEDKQGLFDETQFVYDLELPVDFVPEINDDEVLEFYLWTIEEVKAKIATKEFKPNCALIILDFLIRKGHISADNEPNYLRFLQGIHSDDPTKLFQ